ncbi:MAG TPA: hypothetical protein VLG09_04945 [Candidatus Saccharimonadales bacterium]|nr:hypothetical protein [Candidatus Saccharimonadales bacterium]
MIEQLDRNTEYQAGRQLELPAEEVEIRFQKIIESIDQSVSFDDQERLEGMAFGDKKLGPKDAGNNFGHD